MPVTSSLWSSARCGRGTFRPIEVILVEAPEPEGPYGAKGVGEIGMRPTAAAVANALAVYEGHRRYALPMKDSAAARGLMGVGHAHHHHPHHHG